MPRKPKATERHKRVAKAIAAGAPIKHAMIEEGYSAATAGKGFSGMRERIPALHEAIIQETTKAGREFLRNQYPGLKKEEVERLVEAILIRNSMHGERKQKGSTYAAKTLGQLSRVNMFEPEIRIGIASMPVPPAWKDRYTLPPEKLNATALALPPAPEEEESKPDTG